MFSVLTQVLTKERRYSVELEHPYNINNHTEKLG